MILRTSDRIAEGGFADIFGAPDGSRVFKLFCRFVRDPDGVGVRGLCQSETQAYQVAHSDPGLRSHVPQYFGQIAVQDVIGEHGESIAGRYHLDCCYCLQKLPGCGSKYCGIPEERRAAVEDLAERFEAAGIDHVRDADVFGWNEPGSMKFIDIALYDVVASRPSLFRDQRASTP